MATIQSAKPGSITGASALAGRTPSYRLVLKLDADTGQYKYEYEVDDAPNAANYIPPAAIGTTTTGEQDTSTTSGGTQTSTTPTSFEQTQQVLSGQIQRGGGGEGRADRGMDTGGYQTNRDGSISYRAPGETSFSPVTKESPIGQQVFAGLMKAGLVPGAMVAKIAKGIGEAFSPAPDTSAAPTSGPSGVDKETGKFSGSPSAATDTPAAQTDPFGFGQFGRKAANIEADKSVSPIGRVSPAQSMAMVGNTSLAGMSQKDAQAQVADRSSSIGETGIAGDQSEGPQTGPGGTSGTGYGAPGNFGAANAAAQAMGFEGAVGNTNPNTGLRSAVTDSDGNPVGYGKQDSDSDTGGEGGDSGAGDDGGGATGPGGQSPGPGGQRGGTPSGSASSGIGGQTPGPQGQRGGRGGTGGDSGRIICSELYRQDLISREDYILDLYYTSKYLTEQHTAGYWYFAVPAVKAMRRSKFWTAFWKEIAYNRLQDIKWRLGKGKFNLRGRIYSAIFEPFCYISGYFTPNATYKELYEGEK